MQDEKIIELYWQRNELAIDETQKKYGAYCHAVADGILCSKEDAQECVNDTWLRAWNTIPPQRPGRLNMYLAKITRNLAFDRFKARTAQKRGGGEIALVLGELEECIAGDGSVEEQIIAKELEAAINRFVRSLPAREGNVFVRRYFFGETAERIAGRYGISSNYVTVMLSRTRQKLRAFLKKEGYGL